MMPEADVLAEAFADDPLMMYFWPRSARRCAALPLFWESRVASRMKRGLVDRVRDVDGNVVSVALWEIGGEHAPVARPFTLARALGRRLPRAWMASRHLDATRPERPHLYLATVGTLPDHRGQGHATRLIQERSEHSETDCYLVATRQSNVPFYEKLGFRQNGELHLHRGPVVYPMLLSQ